MSKYKHLPEDKIRDKLKLIDEKRLKQKERLKELANDSKRLKLTLNQKELAEERRIIAKLKVLIGGTFIGVTAIENLEKCIAKMTIEKEKNFVIEHIHKLRLDYKKKE